MFASSVIATPIALVPISSASARTRESYRFGRKNKGPAWGGQAGPGRRSQSYLLPQVAGETSGMRGGGNRRSTTESKLSHCVARGILFSCQPTRQRRLLFL